MSEEEARFWAKVDKNSPGGCWLWTASLRNKGYGAFVYRVNGEIVQGRAHRYSWELVNGPVPAGLCVLHRCDVPACVRPDHLWLGTKAENNADMTAKGRRVPGGTYDASGYRRGEAHHGAKLDAATVREIRARYAAGGVSMTALADEFGIGLATTFRVIRRKTWAHVA